MAILSMSFLYARESLIEIPSCLADEVEETLRKHSLSVWYPRSIDPSGGFFCAFDREWCPDESQPKTLVFQSRMTWVASQVALRRSDLTCEYKIYARHGADFLLTLWDSEEGGFYWSLESESELPQAKHAYGMAFAIYALAAASTALDDPALLGKAVETFHWLEAHARDPEHGGYFEAFDKTGNPVPTPSLTSGERLYDSIGTPFGGKSLNTHIHLLEAYTELFRVWPDARLRERMEELLNLALTRMFVEPGTMNLNYTADWKVLPAPMSFGYDIEIAFLLIDAAAVLGRPNDPKVWKIARALTDHALCVGWDTEHGGLFNTGTALVRPNAPLDKIWWVQVENLNTLSLMHERFGKETSFYAKHLLEQWRFIRDYSLDEDYGGWFLQVASDGKPESGKGESKGWQWKAAYHEVRSLLLVRERLNRIAAQDFSPVKVKVAEQKKKHSPAERE